MQVLLVSAKDGLMARLQLQGRPTKAETDDFITMAFGRVSKVQHCPICVASCACLPAPDCCAPASALKTPS